MEISVERNDAARVAAENASEALLEVRIACSSDDFNTYSFYRISEIVGGALYADAMATKPIPDYSVIEITGLVTSLWLKPNPLLLGVAPSFLVQQIAADKHLGGSARMTLPLLDPQRAGPSAAT